MYDKESFGEFIALKRKEAGLTQKSFAEKLFVTESAVSKWERGISFPDITLVRDICENLHISEHELLTASDDLEGRNIERIAKRYMRMVKKLKVTLAIIYGLTILTCFICNLAVSHTLSWFFIVTASVLLAFSISLLPVMLQKNRAVITILAFFASTITLLLVCAIYVRGDWFWISSVSVLFGMTLIFLPTILSRIEVVIVHKLDRFSRDRYDSAMYKRELRRNGVQLFSVLENLDNSPESVIMESVLEGMAEYYSKNLAREVRKGMRENALKCLHTGGRPAFGYKVDPTTKKWEIDESEVEGVKLIFRRMLEGAGYRAVLTELNALGYRTKNGIAFGKNSLYAILTNEKYKGVYTFNKATSKNIDGRRNSHAYKPDDEVIRIQDGVPAIISVEEFDAVQNILKSRKRASPHPTAIETYLLSGKIFCGECGRAYCGTRKLSGRNRKYRVVYLCTNKDRTNDIGCQNKEINRDYIEKFVLNRMADIIFNENLAPELLRHYKEYMARTKTEGLNKTSEFEDRLRAVNKKINNLVKAVAETGNVSLSAGLDDLERQKAELIKQIENSTNATKEDDIPVEEMYRAIKVARAAMQSGSLPEIRKVINLYLKRVTVYREHIEVELSMLPAFVVFPLNQYIVNRGDKKPQPPQYIVVVDRFA